MDYWQEQFEELKRDRDALAAVVLRIEKLTESGTAKVADIYGLAATAVSKHCLYCNERAMELAETL
jgi:hypothetical protein